jgi:hypothetical protein
MHCPYCPLYSIGACERSPKCCIGQDAESESEEYTAQSLGDYYAAAWDISKDGVQGVKA